MSTGAMLLEKEQVASTVDAGVIAIREPITVSAIVVQKPITTEVSKAFQEYVRYVKYITETLQKAKKQISEMDFMGLKETILSLFLELKGDEREKAGNLLNPYTFEQSSVNLFI